MAASKKRVAKTSTERLKGKFEITKSGTGFVMVEGRTKDILVKPHNFGNALNNDTVEVEVSKYPSASTKRLEGKVTKVIHRGQGQYIGTIELTKNAAFFVPSQGQQIPDFYIPAANLNGAGNGSNVAVKLVKWDKKDRRPEGMVVHVINADNDIDLDIQQIILENGFPLEFSTVSIEEAEKLNGVVTPQELKKRKDYRDVLTFTIDPAAAKDFDDALSYKLLENGNIEVGVHIADVSHFVKPDSMLDKEAYEKATSVYMADRVNPMLPEKISNELCSLRPNEDKYTFAVIFEMKPNGPIVNKWIGRTVIHSNHRFTYEEVQQILTDKKGLHNETLTSLNKLAKYHRKLRFNNGAINFASSEVKFIIDKVTSKPIGVELKESNDSHQLIEEFMLLANRAVAEYISKQRVNNAPVPFPYRVHDQPDEQKLEAFAKFASKYGYHFDLDNEKTVASSFNKMIDDAKGKPEELVMQQLGIRTMSKAVYQTDNIGHYGLGFKDYCHFTSPIRRFPDVLVHRILQTALDGKPYVDKEMDNKCSHCSEREKAAMETERSGNKLMQVLYMQPYIGESFEAVITGVSNHGFWAETLQQYCEGMVSMTDLSEYDSFKLDEENYRLVGLRTGKTFKMGDLVTIQVVAANTEKRQLDYHWVSESGKVVTAQKNKSTGNKNTQAKNPSPAQKSNASSHKSKKGTRKK